MNLQGSEGSGLWKQDHDTFMAEGHKLVQAGDYDAASHRFDMAADVVDDNELASGVALRHESVALEMAGHTQHAEITAARALKLHLQEGWQKYTTVPAEEVEVTRVNYGGIILRNALRAERSQGYSGNFDVRDAEMHLGRAIRPMIALFEQDRVEADAVRDLLVNAAQANAFMNRAPLARVLSDQAVHLESSGSIEAGARSSRVERAILALRHQTIGRQRVLATERITRGIMRKGYMPSRRRDEAIDLALTGYPTQLR